MKRLIKNVVTVCFLLLMLPAALLSGFGRFARVFTLFSHLVALIPGIVGNYARVAYYAMTLRLCSLKCCISFVSFFAHRQATVEDGVYVGAYCVIGRARIGARTQIANNVHILSGRHQHIRDSSGGIAGSEHGVFTEISIGPDCWLGTSAVVTFQPNEKNRMEYPLLSSNTGGFCASCALPEALLHLAEVLPAVIMADVGEGSTIGAGSVVTRAIPPRVVAVGSPARVVRETGAADNTAQSADDAR